MSKVQALQKKFLTEMQKPQCESWIECNKLLSSIFEVGPTLSRQFQAHIKEYLPKIKNLLVLLLIYNHKVKVAETYSYTNPYNEAYITLRKEPNFQKIDRWLNQLKQQTTVNETAELILEGLGGLLHKEVKRVKVEDCKFMLRQLSRYSIRREREVEIVVNFMGRLQGISFAENNYDYNKKEIILIKIIVELLAEQSDRLQNASNLGLVFDEPCLGPAEERNIERYIHLSEEYLLTLSEEQLLSIFSGLTRSSISYLSLSFLLHLTILLARQEEFYKLRYLYEKLILSQIARRGKCCKKANIQDAVLRVTETYVIGFLEHCKIGRVGMVCLLENVELVDNEKNRERWIALGKQISSKEGEGTQDEFDRWIKQKKMDYDVKMCDAVLRGNDIWKITTRSIKKHKVYAMQPSNLTGIVNKGNQCYIISIVQALFMTKLLQPLLEKAKPKKKIPVIESLTWIFKDLKQPSEKIVPNVQRLKRYGPIEFADSERQQDAQDYLISLMGELQKQFKTEGLLDQFKGIFEIQSQDTLLCLKCDYKVKSVQNEYVHTISHKEAFSFRHQEQIDDYQCSTCKQKKVTKTTQLNLKNRILILHINRFSVKNGSTKKELAAQKISRKLQGGYELVGMVFHIGKHIQSGHYLYYSRIQKTRWAEMNDRVVTQFELAREDEEFELEMKEEKTPYILFYKKNEKK